MRFILDTRHPLALDSLDYTVPAGTRWDNSKNPEFNRRLIALYNDKPLSVLDLGCAGGSMVGQFIRAGKIAVGIEGSDYCRNNHRAEWTRVPDNLFTADITKPFTLRIDSDPYQFDVVTLWEVWEHIKKEDLPGVIDNIHRHLKPGGLMIGTINTLAETHHETVELPFFWIQFFQQNGFDYEFDLFNYFHPEWVRKCIGSFGIVMRRYHEETINQE